MRINEKVRKVISRDESARFRVRKKEQEGIEHLKKTEFFSNEI